MRRLRLPGAGAEGREPDDTGAIAVLVAVLLSGGLLLGMGALVIDVGTIAVERERLQSDADSVAWAVAASCALGPAGADSGQLCDAPERAAAAYAGRSEGRDRQAAGNAAACRTTCGSSRPVNDCPAAPADTAGGIAVAAVSTMNDDGTTLLPPVFAQTLDSGNTGTQVVTCSQVVWGVASQGEVLGIAVGLCEWVDSTDGNAAQPAEKPVALALDQPCPAPSTAPEFTWIGDSDCSATVAVGDTYFATSSAGCGDALTTAQDSGKPVLVPIIDRAGAGGLHVIGLGGFVVTGSVFCDPGDIGCLAPPGCPAGTTCVSGHFTRMVVPTPKELPGTTNDYGAAALSRIS
jgi:hypothetical protein